MAKVISTDSESAFETAKVWCRSRIEGESTRVLGIIVGAEKVEAVIEHYEAQGWRLIRINAFSAIERGDSQTDYFVVMERKK